MMGTPAPGATCQGLLERAAWRAQIQCGAGHTGKCGPFRICICRAYVPTVTADSFIICRVQEKSHGDVRLIPYTSDASAATTACHASRGSWFTIRNPPIEQSSPDPALSQTFDAADVVLEPMGHRFEPDVYILQNAPPACSLSAQRAASFMCVGQHGTLDRTIEWEQTPSTRRRSSTSALHLDGHRGACPTQQDVLERQRLRARDDVRPRALHQRGDHLNETTMAMYYTAAGLLIYQVRGLRLEGLRRQLATRAPRLAGAVARARAPASRRSTATRLSVEVALTSSADPNPWFVTSTSLPMASVAAATHNGVSTKGPDHDQCLVLAARTWITATCMPSATGGSRTRQRPVLVREQPDRGCGRRGAQRSTSRRATP